MSILPDAGSFNPAADTRLIEVTPAYAHLLPQLEGKDDVHVTGAESTDALLAFRIGGPGAKKTAFALTDAKGEQVFAAIYVYKSTRPIGSVIDVPGNVGRILARAASTPLQRDPQAFIFYSITNIRGADGKPLKNGSGAMLINALLNHAELPPVTLSTLSPLRSLKGFAGTVNNGLFSTDQRLALAYLHLMERSNPVQKFHMGNGARIGDIKMGVHADPAAPDVTEGLDVMVNYHYPNTVAERDFNRGLFTAITKGEEPSSALHRLFSAELLERIDSVKAEIALMSVQLAQRLAGTQRLAQ